MDRKNNKKIVITTILILAFLISTFAVLPVHGQSKMKTYAFIGAMPNPVGVGQETLLHVGVSQYLQQPSEGWTGITVTVTKPDGTTQTLGPFRTDSTGGTGTVFVPQTAGNYTLVTNFPQQVIPSAVTAFAGTGINVPAGTIMQASTSEPLTLIVQEEQIPPYPDSPLPTEYWSRPINAQHRSWSTVSGNWIGYNRYDAPFVPWNDGPETGHVLWTKRLAMGGLVGGTLGEHAYEDGDAYEGFFASSVIIGGNLYYNRHKADGGTRVEQEVVAVNLRTGEELWVRNWNNTRLAFGQTFYWESWNYMGVFDYLWTTVGTTWNAYDAETGRWEFSINGVPSGTSVRGPKDEIYIYTLNTANGWMTRWNSSRTVQPQNTGSQSDGSWVRSNLGTTFNASRGYDFNVTIPRGLRGSGQAFVLDDKIIGVDVTSTRVDTWALSLKKGQEGTVLMNKTWVAPSSWADGNLTVAFRRISAEDKVFVVWMKETRQWWGFSTETGQLLWGPTEPEPYLNIYASSRDAIGYGKLFTVGYSGLLYAYDIKTGELLWTYTATDPYNEVLWSTNWPLYMGFITDGKIYLHTTEHSANNPKPRGAQFYCIDVETGEEVFKVNIRGHHWGESPIIGDSIIAMYNTYDQLIYAMGRGPSSTTITAPDVGISLGSSITLKGTVFDISPGTDNIEIQKRFPHGVPAVSDDSISKWMQYVYMQFERPQDITGVEVSLSVLDANNNYREIGTTTTNSDGFFTFNWKPDIEGQYTVYASFTGSEAYWPSNGVTAFTVDPAPATPSPTQSPEPSMADQYFLPAIAGIFVLIIIVLVLVVIMMLKKRP
jgi:outer membrane protein assembly factor BamB